MSVDDMPEPAGRGGWPSATRLAKIWDDIDGGGEPTPLRKAELEASEARLREIRMAKAGLKATRFTLVIWDVDIETLAYEIEFDPPLDPESEASPSPAQELGALVTKRLGELLGLTPAAGGE